MEIEDICFRFSRGEILDEVSKLTDYVGTMRSGEDEDIRERVLADDETLDDFGRFIDEALVMLEDGLKENLRGWQIDGDDIVITFEVSRSFDRKHTQGLRKALESFLIWVITGMWFGISNPDESDKYLQKGADWLDRGSRLLYSRRGPDVPLY